MKTRRRRLLRAGLATLALAIAGSLTLFAAWNRHHEKLFEVGSEIDTFLATYSKDFKAMSQALLLTSYAEGADVNFFSQLGEPESMAGAKKIVFQTVPAEARVPVPHQVRSYFNSVEKIDNAKFKLNRLYDFSEGESADIRIRFQVWGLLKTGEGFYDSGLLAATLGKGEEGSWEIRSQEVEDAYRITRPSNTYFTDVTAESGFHSAPGSIRQLDQMFADFKFSVHSRLPRGMGVADVNGDGTLDILLSGVKRAALYINDGAGRFTDASVEWGLGPEESSFSIFPLFVDFDNDGAVDLLLLRQFEKSRLFRNEGGRFKDVSDASGLQISEHAMTASAADYDDDGNIDLFIGSYGNTKEDVPETVVRSRNGQPSHLYRNRGDWTFEEVTKRAGIDHTGWTLASAFYDLNEDGRPDIYVANDFGYNCFYSNNGDGTFTD
ncbi:MAG TPA: VCBS repeat-containing protein, partial [Blastocatellia bacterium]|nr:VCBS repeat-containing protein [Blastocatellia bacterium]